MRYPDWILYAEHEVPQTDDLFVVERVEADVFDALSGEKVVMVTLRLAARRDALHVSPRQGSLLGASEGSHDDVET